MAFPSLIGELWSAKMKVRGLRLNVLTGHSHFKTGLFTKGAPGLAKNDR